MFSHPPKHILFVCTANRTRSAMAEVMFRELLKKSTNPLTKEIQCSSAGVRAYEGTPTDVLTFQVMKKRGFDMSDFKSTKITAHLVREADLVLTMEATHKHYIIHAMPEFASRVFTLKEYLGEKEDADVSDPVGQGVETFDERAEEIETLLTRVIEKISH
ncbi:MAG: low molecular weight protein arginine phosphatase [Candidatus Bathyarchaeia archaeon]